jgi:hypothetical protein
MHEQEKSDSGIVATKPTNKAGRLAAEPVERRPGIEGNAEQQSTLRTQGRERVTQALNRVRQAARQRKREKCTALLHHVTIDALRVAFHALQGRSGSGWGDVGGLRGRPRATARRPARTGPTRSVSATALPPDIHTEGGWETKATGDRDTMVIMHLEQLAFGMIGEDVLTG